VGAVEDHLAGTHGMGYRIPSGCPWAAMREMEFPVNRMGKNDQGWPEHNSGFGAGQWSVVAGCRQLGAEASGSAHNGARRPLEARLQRAGACSPCSPPPYNLSFVGQKKCSTVAGAAAPTQAADYVLDSIWVRRSLTQSQSHSAACRPSPSQFHQHSHTEYGTHPYSSLRKHSQQQQELPSFGMRLLSFRREISSLHALGSAGFCASFIS